MSSPLQILRELLPFGQLKAEQKDVAVVRGLLDTVAGLTPIETLATLAASILPAASQQTNLHMRFKLLEDVRLETEQILPVLEKDVGNAVLPLPHDTATAALYADNLLKGLSIAYAEVARSINPNQLKSGMSHLFLRSVQRAMAMIARRHLMAYRAYALPSASSWQNLHDLYLFVRHSLGPTFTGESTAIEHEYAGTLLFAYLDPSKLPRSELDLINTCSRQLAAYAVIGDAPVDPSTIKHPECCFLVRPDEGSPGYRLSRLPSSLSTFGSLLIDCSLVLGALDKNISRLPGKTVEPDLAAPPVMLQLLRVAISGKSSRRFSRTHFRPRSDLVAGLASVIQFLDGNAFTRRSVDTLNRHKGRDFSSSEWALVDESPDGFRLRFIKGEKKILGSGEIVALQPRESGKLHVCLVRRIASSQGRLEIGIQLISPRVSVADVTTSDARRTKAILLHSLPAYGKFSGLIAAPGLLRIGDAVEIQLPGHALRRQIGNCLEAHEGLEFFALEPIPD